MSKKPTKTTPVTHAEHFRLRLPSEKPTEADADAEGDIMLIMNDGRFSYQYWNDPFHKDVLAWAAFPPAHLIPKPETAEERMRREFEEHAVKRMLSLDRDEDSSYWSEATNEAWLAWQAAKTTP